MPAESKVAHADERSIEAEKEAPMDAMTILKRVAALADPSDDDTEWMIALAADVADRGLDGDEDPFATVEACTEVRRMAYEIRHLANLARQLVEAEEAVA